MKKQYGDYYLGLDIGTDSVGWAVTSPEYDILKFNGKAMWGIRLFDEGSTAVERRAFRTARRRTARTHQRLMLLQELFAEEVSKKDPGFFLRLKESKFVAEDKTAHQLNTLFNDAVFSDRDYHKQYPTIFHLRKNFIEGSDIKDVRLLYLAVAHIIKNRGHFLFPGEDMSAASDFGTVFTAFNNSLEDELGFSFSDADADAVSECLKKKASITSKKKELSAILDIGKNKQMTELCALLSGGAAKLHVLFDEEKLEEDLKAAEIKSFSLAGDFDAICDSLSNVLQDKMVIIESAKAIYDWSILADMLKGNTYISEAKVNSFEQHKKDLATLKRVVKKYIKSTYHSIFRSIETADNYVAYTKSALQNGIKHKRVLKTCTQAAFCDFLKKQFKNISNPDDKELCYILDGIENGTLLPKQRSNENSVVPYQLNLAELRAILQNAEKSFPFLSEKDEQGLTVSEKIIKLLTFKIPYYIGPLNDAHKDSGNCWIVKRSSEKITPWNFESVVDTEQSAENFIRRMTNKCTYLIGEDVLPKHSILYSKYMVLNDLNNVKINGEALPVPLKQKIYNELFLTRKKVKMNDLKHFLTINAGFDKSKDEISGIDGDFKSSMASYIEFSSLLGKGFNLTCAEEAINAVVLFHDDTEILKSRLSKIGDGYFTTDQINKISRMKFSGWGNFSYAFLKEIPEVNPSTGECTWLSITDALWNTQENLMQLLSGSHFFTKNIEARNAEFSGIPTFSYDSLVKDLHVSPNIKRGIWQTLAIIKEIEKITGHPAKKIFIETARGGGEKKRTVSRKNQLLELYKNCKKEAPELFESLSNQDEASLRGKKLYLYYTQMGKCMYTGKAIQLSDLMNNNIYDIDHIYPRSKTKDDSLDNLVLVNRKENIQKSDSYPLDAITREKNISHWRLLLAKGLISKKKFDRLTRVTPFSDEELAGFIARQLVETQQSTKAVAATLKRLYPDTDVVYVKAGVVSDFKNENNLLKCREINDLHHAKDAYVNIVVGNVFDTKFTKNPINFIRSRDRQPYSMHKIFDYDVARNGVTAWSAGEHGTIEKVKKTYEKNNILFTRYAYEETGALFNIQPVKKAKGLMPLKSDPRLADTEKYGGYNKVSSAYFCLVEHTRKGKRIRTIEYVPVYLSEQIEKDKSVLDSFFKDTQGLIEHRILVPKIKINTLFCIDGFYMHISGRTNDSIVFKNAMQLILDSETYAYAKLILKYTDYISATKTTMPAEKYNPEISRESNNHLFNVLIDKMKNAYASQFGEVGKKIEKTKFEAMTLSKQCDILKLIFVALCCDARFVDLSSVNGNKTTGRTWLNKNISEIKSISIINDSPTGLFRQIIDLKAL